MIVIYDNFSIIKKLSHCTLIEYTTVYGIKKNAIILNDAKRIICDLDKNQNFHNFYEQILEEQNRRFYSNKTLGFTIRLIGDYEFNKNEYIVNIPYNLKLKFIYQSSRSLHFMSCTSQLSKNMNKVIKLILSQASKEDMRELLNHQISKIDNSMIVFYEFDEDKIISLSKKRANEKREYNRETYEILMEKYYEEKALMNGRNSNIEHKKNELPKEIIKETKSEIQVNSLYKDIKHIEIVPKEPNDQIENDFISANVLIVSSVKDEMKNKKIITNINISVEDNLLIPTKGSLEPQKKLRTFTATNRNLTIVKYLKALYQNKCQICGEAIEVSPDNFLSEVHHIRPLGEHNGADVIENMIVLCPNHHAMFDRGSITIDLYTKTVIHFNPNNPLNNEQIKLKHDIDRNYIEYHNQYIFVNTAKSQISNCQVEVTNDIEVFQYRSVDYGDIVTLQDIQNGEIFDVKLEDKYNKVLMKPLEKNLIGKFLDDTIEHNGFCYKIITFREENISKK
ncbi:HNH endonuclease [Dehalobacter sp. DCM]|uniref:HNH endonuclease n=1 Tax=Dehalobacter sp. DCM TaxID=2907827 RepID=UPI0030814387|nr:HNH endonuclease [Dehalobacter sp. DCM]